MVGGEEEEGRKDASGGEASDASVHALRSCYACEACKCANKNEISGGNSEKLVTETADIDKRGGKSTTDNIF